ncbi:MAG: hypothetical protein WCB51_14515 [Candidatus Dormiibacterota bacterium]
MTEHPIETDATIEGSRPRGPIEYLSAHPAIRMTCAAAAFTTSLYAVRRSIRSATKLNRAAWTALAAMTAAEGVGIFVAVPRARTPVAGQA